MDVDFNLIAMCAPRRDDLERWRKRADDVRELARGMDLWAKERMLRIAREYDDLARLTEQRLQADAA
jgi:hypothetical protein